MTLPEIEERLWELLGRLDMRHTLRKVVEIGDLMNAARERMSRRAYQGWVARFGLARRSEQLYRQCANLCAEDPGLLERFMTPNGLLRFFRRAKWAARYETRREARQEAMRHAG